MNLFYTSVIDYLHRNIKYLEVEKKNEWGKQILTPKYPIEPEETDRLIKFFHRISPQIKVTSLNQKLIIEKIESLAKSFSTAQKIEGQMLQLIMMHLSKKDFNSAARVSKSWAANAKKAKLPWINAHPEMPLKDLKIDSWKKIIQFCKENKGLTSLNLLEFMTFRYFKNDKFKQIVELCPKLEHVLINKFDMNDESMELLANLTQLKKLQINCNGITDIGFRNITNFKNLKELFLRDCHKISNQGLKYLNELNNLQIIKIDYCFDVKEIILALNGIKNLLAFDCCYGVFNIDNDSLKFLSTHTKLRYLSLGQNPAITDDGLVYLQNLHELEYLNLSGCKQITPAGVLNLMTLTNLKEIVLPLTDQFFNHPIKIGDFEAKSLKDYFPSCLFD